MTQANSLLPALATIEASPTVLKLEAERLLKDGNRIQANAILSQLVNHKSVLSSELESAGDMARRQLGNIALALRLYERAVEEDNLNYSAEAELLYLRSMRAIDRPAALQRLRELSGDNPNEWNVVRYLLYTLRDAKEIAELRAQCERLAAVSRHKSLIYRYLAETCILLGEPGDVIVEAFDLAMLFGKADPEFILSSAAMDYSAYLLTLASPDFQKILRIIEEALRENPTYALLHRNRGDAQRRSGDFEGAMKSYNYVCLFGDERQREEATNRMKMVITLKELSLS